MLPAFNVAKLEHDLEKWKPVFRKDHAQTKSPPQNTRVQNKNAGRKARVSNLKTCEERSARSARAACAATAATSAAFATRAGAEHRLRLHRQQAFALQLLAGQLARAAHGFGLFAGLLLGGLFVVTAELHLAENTLALHLLLERLEGLIDVVIADENLHAASSFQLVG